MKRIAALAVVVATIAAAPQATTTVGAWSMVTERLNADLRTGAFSAPDHVEMTRADGSTVTADRASGNYKQRLVTLYGNVVLHDEGGSFGLQSARSNERGPANLTADTLTFDDATHLYDASGHVHYTQADRSMDAEHAHLDDESHELTLDGDVHVVDGNRTLDAQHAVYNTQSGLGQAAGNVVMEFPGAHIAIATPKPIVIKGPKI